MWVWIIVWHVRCKTRCLFNHRKLTCVINCLITSDQLSSRYIFILSSSPHFTYSLCITCPGRLVQTPVRILLLSACTAPSLPRTPPGQLYLKLIKKTHLAEATVGVAACFIEIVDFHIHTFSESLWTDWCYIEAFTNFQITCFTYINVTDHFSRTEK